MTKFQAISHCYSVLQHPAKNLGKEMPESPLPEDKFGALKQPPWFLYLIECVDGSIYTGIAIDVEARFSAHASGKGARYTRTHPPLRVLVSVKYPDRSSALKAEYRIKQLKPAAKREFVAQMSCATKLTPP